MDDIDKWRKAGKIAAQALEYGCSLIKNGANIKEVCDKIDNKIIELGAKPAWPSQVGFNGVAAHWTSDYGDEAVFDNHVVCLDVGAHIDGCVGDNAATVDLSGKYKDLLNASQDALDAAIKIIRPGVTLGEIGKVIEEKIRAKGFEPIRNLSGHGISQWVIHDAPSIPNYDTKDEETLEEGQIIAIEPFATTGVGSIVESEHANIFSFVEKKPVRSQFAREIVQYIESEYGPMPFATRWLVEKFGLGKTNLALNELSRIGSIHPHPPLVEKKRGVVAVFEKTIIVGEKSEITTKL